jgi:hypothetical protein
MRKWTCAVLAALVMATGCSKKDVNIITIKEPETKFGVYTEYLIKKGEQESNHGYQHFDALDTLAFTVKFDTSCRYKTQDPLNQIDVNKLYGFSDNGKEHHQFSARFGWYFNENKLTLHAYVYNNGVRSSRILKDLNFNQEAKCGLVVRGDQYLFVVDGQTFSMPRSSATPKGNGYKLYPYFGGDELAPHDMKIWIRDDRSL